MSSLCSFRELGRRAACALTALLVAASASAAAPKALTHADYARAERLMPYDADPLVLHSVSHVTWVNDGHFWYRTRTAHGSEFILVNAATGARRPAFDQARLAAALSAAAGARYGGGSLPFDTFGLSREGGTVSFDIGARRWSCDMRRDRCRFVPRLSRDEARSPDGKWAAFIRDHNLWVRNLATGAETQLTFDGAKSFGYATDNMGWEHSRRAVVSWSPDSRRIATYRLDERGVADMYLVRTEVGHPTLEAWPYAMPGDKVVPTIRRVVIDVPARKVVRLRMAPDQARTAHCYALNCGPDGSMTDVQWSPGGRRFAFVSVSRDHRTAWLRVADARTGVVRTVIEERTRSFYESATGPYQNAVNWRYLFGSHEAIWFSQRAGWGNLYLYDTRTGKLKNRITTGAWNVVDLLKVDRRRRLLYLLGVGREAGNPYFAYLYRVGFDGRHLRLLTPQIANHVVSMSPSGRYFVDTYSTPDTPPVTVLRTGNGRLISTLEKADISRLRAAGWRPPVPITVKAHNGVTNLYGLMFEPADFHPGRQYPLIDRIYPGPQIGSVMHWGFEAAHGDSQALAQLGFIVVQIDGRGTSLRSQRFEDAYHGDLINNTLPDQVAAIRRLARRYRWIDLRRVGILGHSGGGYAAVAAMLRYPKFFKVGVAESGNYDQRGYEADWGEQYMGLLKRGPDGRSNYDRQDDQRYAGNLRGHLLLIDGTMDRNVPPYLTMLLVKALIDANKNFSLIMLPNQDHTYRGVARLYAVRRSWDYFVRHLLGARPPLEFALHPPAGAPRNW